MVSEHLPSKLYTYSPDWSIHQPQISMSKFPDQQTKVSHTCAMAGENLSERQLSQLARAQSWIAMASSGQSRQGTDEDQKPSEGWEQETTKAARFQTGAINSVLAGLMGSCPACSVSLGPFSSDTDDTD